MQRGFVPLLVLLFAAGCKPAQPNDDQKGVTIELPPATDVVAANALENSGEEANSLNVLTPSIPDGEEPPAPPPKPVPPATTPKLPEPDAAAAPAAPRAESPPAPDSKTPAPAPTPPPTAPAPESSTAAARPPLSDERIASTIERIGYQCGQVVSTERVTGGVDPSYRITCSSGQVYRGTNRSGHMRFRKWGG